MAQLGIRRNINLLFLKVKYSVMNMAEYRADIIITSIGTYAYMIITLIFLNFILYEFNDINGWTKYEVLMIFVTSQIIFYIFFAFFSYIEYGMSRDIENGEFDRFLTKPINLLFNLSTEELRVVHTIPGLLFTFVLAAIAFRNLNIDLSNIPLYLFAIVITFAVFYLAALCIGLLSFWMTDTTGLNMLYFRAFGDFSKYPATIFPKNLRAIFLTILPISLISYVPSYFLLRGFDLNLFFIMIFTLVLFIVISRFLWVRGLAKYSSASS